MNLPTVTVVIIVFNDEDRINVAIESAMRQTLREIEIVVVDHGSTDGTAAVVQKYIERDSRIRLVQLPDNVGEPGRPLNAGIDDARGDWITVMGSDDELEPDACRYMLSFAELRSVDVVLGKVSRVNPSTPKKITYWHSRLYREERTLSRIEDAPEYISDTISAGKLYRRSFLNDRKIRFPEDILYEDQLFTLKVYHQADGIQVLPETVYRWYSRPNAKKKSITNSRDTIKNFEDRISVNRRIDEYLRLAESPALSSYKSEKFIRHDLNIYLNNLEEQQGEYREQFGALSREYLSAIALDKDIDIHPILKVIVGLLKIGEVESAVAAHKFRLGRGPLPVDLWSDGGRKYWLDKEQIARSGLGREWFDVTSLGIHLVPFKYRKFSVESRSVELNSTCINIDVLVGDKGRSLESGIESVSLVLRRRRDQSELSFPVRWEVISGTEMHVCDSVNVEEIFSYDMKFHENWDLWIDARKKSSVKSFRVPQSSGATWASVLELPASKMLTGNQITSFTTDRGNYSLRVEQSGRLANGLAWRYAKAKRQARTIGVSIARPFEGVERSRVGKKVSSVAKKAAGAISVRRRVKASTILFEAYRGRQYSDSPKALSDQLHVEHPEFRQYWSYRYERTLEEFPPYVTPVKYDSVAYHRIASGAAYWVDNFGLDPRVQKHRDTIYLQTWHGVPLKRLFFDAPKVMKLDDAKKAQYGSDLARWDFLVSQGQYFENTLVRATNTAAKLIRSGSPRNDLLLGMTDDDRDRLKHEMDLPFNRKIVLYMPTYRGKGERSAKYSSLDYRVLSEQLQEEWFMLSRQHYYRRGTRVSRDLRGFVRDVSKYPNVEDLMMVADVLITDFSSAMFDYSLLERPILYHVPDMDDYEKVAPRTYVPLENIAPGPLCFEEQQVVDALRSVASGDSQMASDVSAFRQKFMPLEEGNSSSRVIQAIWGHP